MSWAPEVIADSSGKWCGNAVRFATKEEAEADVRDLANRWFMVRETRVVESADPVNFKRVRGVSVTIDSTMEATPDLLYGVQAIANYLGLKPRAVYHLTATDRLPHFKVGKTLCSRRSRLLAALEDLEARQA
jgi:hypothetical protein